MAIDFDKEFVRVILRDGMAAYKLAIDKGISEDRLFGDGKSAWIFISEHVKHYGSIPSKDLLLETVVNSEGKLIDLNAGMFDTAAALIDKILERSVLTLLTSGTKKLLEKISQHNAKEALETWTEIHRKIQNEAMSVSKIESLFSLGQEVIDYYDLVKNGMTGIPTPWPTLDNQTIGWWPEDLALVVGRLGQGKTFFLLLIAYAAWVPGKRVLICTTEMSRRALATRFLCMHFRLPYGDFRRGKLGEFIESKMRDGIASLMMDQGVQVVGNDFDYSIDSLDAAVQDDNPDMLVLDGVYLIKNSGKDRQEKVANTFDDLKRIGKRRLIPVVASTQFNRQAKSGQEDSISADNIGITDVAGWNADVALGLFQTKEMFEANIMGVKPLKIREGKPETFNIRWDLNGMQFEEIQDPSKPAANLMPPRMTTPISSVQDESDDMPDVPF